MNILIIEEEQHRVFGDASGVSRREAERRLRAVHPSARIWWWDDADAAASAPEIEGIVTARHGLGAAFLERFPKLRWLSLGFTGYDDLDQEVCRRRGIAAYSVPGYSTHSVAELTVGLALSLFRRIPVADRRFRAGHFDDPSPALSVQVRPGRELRGTTVGILGTGRIGLRSAALFAAFGCTLLGASPTHRPAFAALGGTYDTLDAVLERADVLALHLPYDPTSGAKVAAREIGRMKQDAVLINPSRTRLVSLPALADALDAGQLAGAALDVTERTHDGAEADAIRRLSERDNVILTPHLGFATAEALARLADEMIENVRRAKAGDAENRIPLDVP